MNDAASKRPAWVLESANPPTPRRGLLILAAILLGGWNLFLLFLAAFTGHLLW